MASTNQSKYLSKLQGKRVLILGGTSGLGFAVAEASLEHGAQVIISSSSPTKVNTTIDRLKDAYPLYASNIAGKDCDLSKPETLEKNLTELFEFAGKGIHHIVITAGNALEIKHISEAPLDYLQNVGNVRFLAPLVLSKIAPPFLVSGPESSITFTGGSNATKPIPAWGVLAAYGAGLEGLTRGMARDLKPIRVNVVSPGVVLTEFFDSVSKEIRDNVLNGVKSETLSGEIGRPEDVAEAYLYLMKDRFTTGKVIQPDGGRLLC